MAIGSIFFTLPIAFLCSIWMTALHGLNALETLGLYSALGTLTLSTLFLATVFALRDLN